MAWKGFLLGLGVFGNDGRHKEEIFSEVNSVADNLYSRKRSHHVCFHWKMGPRSRSRHNIQRHNDGSILFS